MRGRSCPGPEGEGPPPSQLPALDEIIGTLNPDLDDTGSLSSLALRLSAERRDKIEGKQPGRAYPAELDQENTR